MSWYQVRLDSEQRGSLFRCHIMLGSKMPWVHVPEESETERHFEEYPGESLESWHESRKLLK